MACLRVLKVQIARVEVLKEKRTANPDYKYDIFVSYIHGSMFQDWPHRVIRLLESWLTLELGRRPRRYNLFRRDLSILCDEFTIPEEEMAYSDLSKMMRVWRKA